MDDRNEVMQKTKLWGMAAIVCFSTYWGWRSLAQTTDPPAEPIQHSLTAPEKPATFVSRDGIKITPLEAQKDDLAQILGMEMWKFNLVLPEPGMSLNCKLELRQKGKPAKTITSVGLSADASERELLVALYTSNGPFERAPKLKYYLRWGGMYARDMVDNPLRGLGDGSPCCSPGGTSILPTAQIQKDGSLVLMAFTRSGDFLDKSGNFPYPDNSLLTLTITAAKSTTG
jgi:hypothetical protein